MKLPIAIYLLLSSLLVFKKHAQDQYPSGTFKLDTSNTQIAFSAKHFGVLKVQGTFHEFSGQMNLKNGSIISGSLTIMVASVSTNNNGRDRSLKSDDFLAEKKYPTIDLEIVKDINSLGEAQILTQIKKTKNIIDLEYKIHEDRGDFQLIGSCTISRKAFNLDFGTMDDLVSDEIIVQVNISLERKKP